MKLDCIALDLDETLLDSRSHLSPVNSAALESAISQGIQIVLASGRALHSFPQELLHFPGIRYAITGNGTSIVDLRTGELLCRYLLSPQAVLTVLEATKPFPLTYEAFIDGHAYTAQDYMDTPERFGADEQSILYVRRTRQGVPDIRSFIFEHRHELDAIDLITHDSDIKHCAWEAVVRSGAEVYITSSVPRMVEISNQNCGKAPALRWLLHHLHLSPEHTAAFGNADNDAEMLAAVHYGIAVENATPACKMAARYITKHHNADGVAWAMAEYLHLEVNGL